MVTKRPSQPLWDAIHDAIIDMRDGYPRIPQDAPSDRLADVVLAICAEYVERLPLGYRPQDVAEAMRSYTGEKGSSDG